jgi:two-component system nitrate/nitrite response regulator NarL
MKAGRTGQELIRVLVSDDTRIHTQLLADVLRREPSLEVFTPASHLPDIVEAAVGREIDVAVISSRLDEEALGGLEATRKIRALRPNVRCVVLLDSTRRETVLACFRAGARGVFSRDSSAEALSECVRKVHAGEIWANSEQITVALEALAASPTVRAVDAGGLNLLSKRELEVVSSLAEGLSNREIAARLGLSQHTIKNYLFRVFDKLGVSSRIELLFLTLDRSATNQPWDAPDGSTGERASSFASSQRAAEQGLPTAQIALAHMYFEGKGVQRNPASAYMWYLVCEQNLLEMKDAISAEKRKIAGLLTTDEILESQKLASEHQKKPAQTAPHKFSSLTLAAGDRP